VEDMHVGAVPADEDGGARLELAVGGGVAIEDAQQLVVVAERYADFIHDAVAFEDDVDDDAGENRVERGEFRRVGGKANLLGTNGAAHLVAGPNVDLAGRLANEVVRPLRESDPSAVNAGRGAGDEVGNADEAGDEGARGLAV